MYYNLISGESLYSRDVNSPCEWPYVHSVMWRVTEEGWWPESRLVCYKCLSYKGLLGWKSAKMIFWMAV